MTTSIVREETKKVFKDLDSMLELVLDNHLSASKAIKTGSQKLAQDVLEADKKIDKKYLEIESELEFLIAKTPFARDLRRTLAALHIADELERIGDYAKHIAKFILKTPKMSDSSITRIDQAHKPFLHMLKNLSDVLTAENADQATKLAKKDDHVDEAVQNVKKSIISSLVSKSDPKEIEERVNVLNIISALERAADHIVIVCELIAYVETGNHNPFF